MRLRHIDRIRAVAVLCMVEVHTAAILPPRGMTVGDPGAFIAAAFGGMAATKVLRRPNRPLWMGNLDFPEVGRSCFLPVFGECSSQC